MKTTTLFTTAKNLGQKFGRNLGKLTVTAAVSGALFSLMGTSAMAGPTQKALKCQSIDQKAAFCDAGFPISQVTVQRQLSYASCKPHHDYGIQGSKIWVRNGCRAEFLAYHKGHTHGGHSQAGYTQGGHQVTHGGSSGSTVQYNSSGDGLTAGQGLALFGAGVAALAILSHLHDDDDATGATVHAAPKPKPVNKPTVRPHTPHYPTPKPVNREAWAKSIIQPSLRREARSKGYRGAKIQEISAMHFVDGVWRVRGVAQYNARAANPGPKFRFFVRLHNDQVVALRTRGLRRDNQHYTPTYAPVAPAPQHSGPYQGHGSQGQGYHGQGYHGQGYHGQGYQGQGYQHQGGGYSNAGYYEYNPSRPSYWR